jgi:hypothetical protein
MFSQLNGNQLFIGPGLGYISDIKYSQREATFINDYWQLDLIKKEWRKLGKSKVYLKSQ